MNNNKITLQEAVQAISNIIRDKWNSDDIIGLGIIETDIKSLLRNLSIATEDVRKKYVHIGTLRA